jgi:cytochrome b subunit of formate dehydrogenase
MSPILRAQDLQTEIFKNLRQIEASLLYDFGMRPVLVGLASLLLSSSLAFGQPEDAGVPAAAPTAAPSAASPQGCTSGCHEDITHEFPKHKDVTCEQCHPNIPDGKVDHVGALDDTPTDKMCATAGCHPSAAKKTLEGKHKDAPCEACHGDSHGDFVTFEVKSCKSCHKEAFNAHVAGLHWKAKTPVTCANCHGDMHDVKLHTDPLSPMSKVLQVSTCIECHDEQKVKAFRHSVHGEGLLKSGLSVAPTCSSCHGSHDITKVDDPASKVSRENVTQTCGSCHEFMVTRWKTSAHGQAFANAKTPEEKEKAPVCTNCHDGHATIDPSIGNNHLNMVAHCEQCHESQSKSYRASFHGKATRMGMGMAATCADCHSAHDMLSKDDPNSTVHMTNLQATCAECHPGASASFVKFLPHNDPSDPKSDETIHTIWLFMTTLLMATLGFFALHTALWLQRSIVGFSRGEFKHESGGDVWIRRFRPVHIWIHIVIILTFLTLAATGLPIKFAGATWTQPFAAVPGGIDFARWVHKAAGVLTFGYGLWFVGYLVREIIVRKRRSLLWGWQSMVPNKKDLVDLVANLKWFLYMGPRPKLDRWAYWEKFDFFAVFWGVPVIGFSGLMLWKAVWVSEFLPGWVLNIAYLVHSDEALLATGFIFFFHFFHTHLRPEAFPLDPVIFTGSMPLGRFIHERPAEYERLEASGELESYKVPPPSAAKMATIYRFGFTALTLGVLLGIGLLWGFFTGFH